MKNILLIGFLSLLISCSQKSGGIDKEVLKKEVKQTENDFQKTLAKDGTAIAFYTYADENAVINRGNDSLIHGREAIRNYYSKPTYKNAIAQWEPDFIDVSDDGTLAYTYGKYSWDFTDSLGKITTYKGIFHTVWKKTSDGTWKYVWD